MTRKKQKTYWAGFENGVTTRYDLYSTKKEAIQGEKWYRPDVEPDIRKIRIVQVRS